MAERRLALSLIFNGTGNLSSMMRKMTGEGGQARASLRNLTDAAKAQKKELGDLQKQIGAVGVPTREMVAEQRRLESQLSKTNLQIDRQKSALARQGRADAMGDAARSSGTQNIATGVGMATPLVMAGKHAADTQDAMTQIQIKADLSAAATEKIKKNMYAAAQATMQLPNKIQAGMDTLTGAGLNPQDAVTMMTPVGKAATAYMADVTDLSNAAFAAQSNLKVPITETERALDAMAAAGKEGQFEMRDMAAYFPKLTAQAQAFGQKGVGAVADLGAALQVAYKAAGSSEGAANNINNLFGKINTEETQKKFAKFGVDLPAALKKAYAEGKTPLEAIAEITNKAVGGDLSKLSLLFGDQEAQSGVRALIQNMDEYKRIREKAMKAVGVVNIDFEKMSKNANANGRVLQGNLIAMADVMGAQLLPAFVELSQKALILTARFSAWAEKNPETLGMIVKMVAVLAMLSIGLGAARIAFGLTVGPLMKLYNGFMFLKNSAAVAAMLARAGPMMATAFGVMRTAALFLARGLMQAGLMMMANPIILIIVAIVAAVALLGYLVYKNLDKVKAAFGAFMEYMRAVGTRFKTIGAQIMMGLINGITERISAIKSLILGIAGKVAGWFKGVLGIKSPSRVFMAFGGHISDGLAIGIRKSMERPMMTARAMAAGVAGAMTVATSPLAMADSSPNPPGPQSLIRSLPQIERASAAAGQSGPAPIHIGSITIGPIIAATGQSTEDLAIELERVLRARLETTQASSRTNFGDED